MPNIITQDLYNLTKQSIRNYYIKINLLDFKMRTVDEISGNAISGSITIDANADIRRTCAISLIVNDSSFEIEPGGKIWLDKYIQIFVGIENPRTKEIEWTNQGVYIIDTPTWAYDAVNNTLSFQGLDLMAKMTGLRNGNLPGIPSVIPAGSNIRNVMISTITQLGGFSKYSIDENPQTVPYEIKVETGQTVYDILVALRDIVPNWEIFFDVDGVFHYQPIPSGQNEQILIDDDTWDEVLISENVTIDFTTVKNVVEVWGKSLDVKYYGANVNVSGNVYNVAIAGVNTLTVGMIYGFTAPSIFPNPYLKINNMASYRIVDENGNSAVFPEANRYYVVRYDNGKFTFLGFQQPYAIAKDDNPNSPFYTGGTIGEIREVLMGGNYENIYSNSLAQQRANYELWKRTRLNDNISISCVPVLFADVNTVVSYTMRDKKEKETYIIKNISTDLSVTGTQNIVMIKYYPLYPDI